jgi:hypothetical protein
VSYAVAQALDPTVFSVVTSVAVGGNSATLEVPELRFTLSEAPAPPKHAANAASGGT